MEHNYHTVRTDLALEAREVLTRQVHEDIPGVLVETSEDDDVIITRVNVTTPEAEKMMGKMQGKYITIEAPGLRYKNTPLQQKVMNFLANELVEMVKLPRDATVLVVGLGNWNVTPDALGPRAAQKIVVTRHLQEMLSPELKGGVRSVCAITPGVLGITGMETGEIIQGIVSKISPNLVLAIDALAAASSQRVITTVQLANTGIHPGSGVGNKRFGLTQASLGVPVVAIGVPTVVHASTIAMDTINTLQEHAAFARYFKSMSSLSDQDRHTIVRQVLPEMLGDLMVTPKEVDRLIEDIAAVVAGGINQAMHPNIDYENIHMYLH
ncbi:GPR endopeptidase [Sporomusa acidovorans]|uniref:Germination protease n=1 Tax=Sporomusa acidovorans (strain ATCC 49682 / DSM 3132 / Mol) TaxID=1123286 RepID=A0ABZ3J3V0_SPOA4|nr:GPR endopeptidase [Sporomusa acidovorans]OZC23104.1 germination protease precursor [Sporomusa acidovorans DSM 3132]SDF05617.1 spore protease [Sporomusa acidovorans]